MSGHSLGAGTAALAVHLLRTQPSRAAVVRAQRVFAPAAVTAFCAAPPPVLSLRLAQSTAPFTTSIVLGHDVVARASLANFEQLRLEVLASGWWSAIVDPVVQSDTFRKVEQTLERVGAAPLVSLAREAGSSTSARAGTPTAPAPASSVSAMISKLHQLYVQPTVRPIPIPALFPSLP
jgi:Lipase (class 3)